MGQIIRKDAAADAVVADARTARNNAAARGGVWQILAEQRLGPVLTIHDNTEAEYQAAVALAAPLVATRDAERARAKALVGRVYDELWNSVGRPANDSALALIFPNGIAYFVEGETSTMPKRMELLAKLMTANLHPQIPLPRAQAAASEIQAGASALRIAMDDASTANLQVELLEQVLLAISRNAGASLASLKKQYKAEGFREADIHTVIPNRRKPAASKKATPKAADAPQAPPQTPLAKGEPTG